MVPPLEILDMTTNKKFYSPSEIKVYDAKGDLNKKWFVYYYNAHGKRIRVYGDINKKPNPAYRYKRIDALKFELLGTSQKEDPKQPSIMDLLYKYVEYKRPSLRHKSHLDYLSRMRVFEKFLNETYPEKLIQFSTQNAHQFLEHLSNNKGLHPTTRNDYRMFLKSAFNWLIKRQLYFENPFDKTEPLRSHYTPSLYFQKSQIEELKAVMEKEDPELWLFVQFIYYCFIRPGELRLMKVSDIMWDEHLIRMRPEISKNKKQQFVNIPEPFRPVTETHFRHCQSGNYLFGKFGCPGPSPYSVNVMSTRHRKILQKLNYAKGHVMYSWKHTGAVMAVKAGINIKQLQLQLRHHSLDQVDQYLKDLGVADMEDLVERFPGI